MRRNASENAFGLFGNLQFPSQLDIGINLARIIERNLQDWVLHLFGILYDRLDCKGANLACFLVQFGAQVLLRLVVFSRRDHDGIFHRVHYNLRIDAFFPTQGIDGVIKFTCHKIISRGICT